MQLVPQMSDDALVVRVESDRLDAAAAIEFKDRLRGLARGGPPRVVLDLGPVEFLDSSGLGAIVAAMKLLAPDQCLELSSPSATVDKVLRLTRMDRVFRIHRAPDGTAVGAAAGANDAG